MVCLSTDDQLSAILFPCVPDYLGCARGEEEVLCGKGKDRGEGCVYVCVLELQERCSQAQWMSVCGVRRFTVTQYLQ